MVVIYANCFISFILNLEGKFNNSFAYGNGRRIKISSLIFSYDIINKNMW